MKFRKLIKFVLILLLIFIFNSNVSSQDSECGYIPLESKTKLAQKSLLKSLSASDIASFKANVRTALHVLRKSDGTGGVTPAEVTQSMIDANSNFTQVGFTFIQVKPIDYIDDDTLYFDLETPTNYSQLVLTNNDPNTIDIYFVPLESGFPYCGVANGGHGSGGYAMVRQGCTGVPEDPSALSHEIGHYYFLAHTHATSSGFECPDGGNCAYSGDFICDTPADPRLNYSNVDENCNYIGTELPPVQCIQMVYNPSTVNLMSYSRRTCTYEFTPEQIDVMNTFLTTIKPLEILSSTLQVPSIEYPTIQSAIDDAAIHDTIIVSPGIYSGVGNVNLNFNGKPLTLISETGASNTIIDCGGIPNRGFIFNSGENRSTVVDGFTVFDGNPGNFLPPNNISNNGGGAYISSNPIIKNCIFDNCHADRGGAVEIVSNFPAATDSMFVNCFFTNNSASNDGGAIHFFGTNSGATFYNCEFENNSSSGAGVIGASSAQVTVFYNCLFNNNNSSSQSSVITASSYLTLINCNITNNDGSIEYGAVNVGPTLVFNLQNSIIAYNNQIGVNVTSSNTTVTFKCNVFYSNYDSQHYNMSQSIDPETMVTDPMFCDYVNNVFTIDVASYCHPSVNDCGGLIGKFNGACGTCCDLAGDAANSGTVSIVDVTFLIARIFSGGPPPPCCDEGDADGGGSVSIGDVTYLIARIFSSGSPPICPSNYLYDTCK